VELWFPSSTFVDALGGVTPSSSLSVEVGFWFLKQLLPLVLKVIIFQWPLDGWEMNPTDLLWTSQQTGEKRDSQLVLGVGTLSPYLTFSDLPWKMLTEHVQCTPHSHEGGNHLSPRPLLSVGWKDTGFCFVCLFVLDVIFGCGRVYYV
jgi:hypothetical protein